MLAAIWIVEASVGLAVALFVFVDATVILRALGARDVQTARHFRLQVARDVLVLSGQVVNVLIGLISGVLIGRAHDGMSNLLGAATLAGLMLAPALLGGISLVTYRSRHR